jgi:tRNA-uridine 2-sulfurtransferase
MYRLLSGIDKNKDQSYFLCQISQEQLSQALFPIGHLTKPEVRRTAAEIGLPNADKKDSQGLCFIGKVKLPLFLQQQLAPKKGIVTEVMADDPQFESRICPENPSEEDLARLAAPFEFNKAARRAAGEHQGAHYFTVGQRKGLGVGGRPEPLFIVHTDTVRNEVIVGQGEMHPALYRSALFMKSEDISWIRPDRIPEIGKATSFMARIRYRQPLTPCLLYRVSSGIYLQFMDSQRGVAPGQFAAWYDNDELLGSGVIAK